MLIGETPVGEVPGIGDSFSVMSKTYGMDSWVIFSGSEVIDDPPGTIRYYVPRNWDALLQKGITSSYDGLLALSKNDYTKSYNVFTSLLHTLVSADFDLVLRPSYESTIPSTSVISAIVWSYVELLDATWRQLDTMANALKLDWAWGDDLDNAWGLIYDLPRISEEDDTNYRNRLKTRTNILNGSGTKSNCEDIINNIIGESCTNVETVFPAKVKVTFDTFSGMQSAKEKKSTLDLLIPQMLAAGISYDLLIPYSEYLMTIVMNGPIWLPYNNYLAIQHRNEDTSYDFYYQAILRSLINIDTDILLTKTNVLSYLSGIMMQNFKQASYNFDSVLFKTVPKSVLFDQILTKKNINLSYVLRSYLQKYDNEKSLDIDFSSVATIQRIYQLSNYLTFQNTTSYLFDVILRLFQKTIDVDTLINRQFPEKYSMKLTLVGA